MKKRFFLVASGVMLFVASCEKDDPATPGNEDPTTPGDCSFCLGEALAIDPSTGLIETNAYGSQVPFVMPDGTVQDLNPAIKTPNGFYGTGGGVSFAYNGSAVDMSCVPNKLTFAYVTSTENTGSYYQINIQLPGTPLISTIPDSLPSRLLPYGYTAERFWYGGMVNTGMDPSTAIPGYVDSIVIHGPGNIGSATIGGELIEAELRNICISHE